MPRILVIDDNRAVHTALSVLFSLYDIHVISADSPEAGLALVESQPVDLVIQDMNFSGDMVSGAEGIQLFHAIRDRQPDLPVILLTAWTHLEQAVALVKAGAADYLSKPWDDSKLVTAARNLIELGESNRREQKREQHRKASRRRLAQQFDLCGLIYHSDAMHELLTIATRVAATDVPVLITGPNGAGKEKIAEIIQANAQNNTGPFIKVNAGALPDNLVESELFGTASGAYTGAESRAGRFEAADNGTLFLDEIGNLPLPGQAKLLRALQTGEFERLGSHQTRRVKVRVISATNTDLPKAVANGSFREDLLYRLNLIELALPALRDRSDDILPLAEHFLPADKSFDESAERALLGYPWPGNVRELENAVKRAAILSAEPRISAQDLGLPSSNHEASFSPDEINEVSIRCALDNAGGVLAKAARSLGLSRQALYRRMEKFGIER